MNAKLKQIRISPKKANLVAALIRNQMVSEALDQLKFTNKKAALIIRKIIASAMANAENNFNQKRESLYIKEVLVSDGPTYKRSIPISKGRAHPLLKRTSHITVKLAVKEDKIIKKVEEKTEDKPKKKVSTKENK